MPDIFLSYSREDQVTARRFAEALEREGFDVWWDQTLRTGENYDRVTEAALRGAKAVIVLWSVTSVESQWVRAEATTAERRGTLLPVMIGACERPIMFELKHTAELEHWKGELADPAWRAFLEDVRRLAKKDTQSVPVPVPVPASAQARSGAQRSRRLPVVLGTLGAVLAGATLVWLVSRNNEPLAGPPVRPAAAVSAEARPSLAVLPFANLSGDPSQEYFSDGLTEEILNELAQVRGLRLIARTSSFAFKGRNEDVRAIGEKLDVANLLEGSVRKDGEALRITAQLIDSADGSHRWSKTYDGKLTSVFTLQEEIARDVAQALSITLDVGEMTRARGGTNDVEAYDAYLRAKSIREAGGPGDQLEQSSDLYRDAVRRDPGFTTAWVELYQILARSLTFRPRDNAVREEMAEILRRLEVIAPDARQTLAIRTLELQRQRRWAEAAEADKAYLAAAPESACSLLEANVGRTQSALRCVASASFLDPLSRSVSAYLQILLDSGGRSAEAAREYERIRALDGDRAEGELFKLLREWRREAPDPAAVRRQFRKVAEMNPGALFAPEIGDHLEDREYVLSRLRKALAVPGTKLASDYYLLALFAAHYGDRDLAFAALRERVAKTEATDYFLFLWGAYENGLRSDPRFKELLRELGLVDYFRESGTWNDYCSPVGRDDFECR